MPVSFYEVAWIFVIYAFLGWCTEVAYAALNTGKFVNRGFLNGPVCPVYGCGVLVVIVVLTPLKYSFLILFIGSILLTSIIEFITGFLLEKLFHNQWWDYSEQPFNICGYVCLKFSILWGIACVLVMDVVHPTIYAVLKVVPKLPGTIILVILCIVFVVDIVITVSTILKFNQHLKMIDELGAKIKVVSDEIGENIYEGVTTVLEKGEGIKETMEVKSTEFSENHEELVENLSSIKSSITDKKDELTESFGNVKSAFSGKKEELLQLQAKYKEALEKRNSGERRLMKAFPAMRAKGHEESYNRLKRYFEEKREEKKEK